MKTTRNMMMSLVLAGSMVLGASFASAQTMSGRQRPTTSSSSSSSTTRSTTSNNRNATSSSTSTPQVRQSKTGSAAPNATQRSSMDNSRVSNATTSSSSRNSTVTARPSTSTTTTTSRPSTVTARPDTRTTNSGSMSRPSTVTRSTGTSVTSKDNTTTTTTTRPGSVIGSSRGTTTSRETTSAKVSNDVKTNDASVVKGSVRNDRPAVTGSNSGGDKGKPNGDRPNGNVGGGKNKPGGNNYSDNRGGSRRGGNRPPVAKPENNPYRDHFRNNYERGNWGRPLPPPARPYRPAPIHYYRPVVPTHYRPFAGAPVIDRILGLHFGSLFDISLNYLYTNNYYIDGYDSDIIYLRDVRMLNLLWPDVLLCYDSYGRLANAQFVISTGYADRSRYNRLYHDLCAVYGPPISVDAAGATWFGGNTTGYVTLSAAMNGARFYTTLLVGY